MKIFNFCHPEFSSGSSLLRVLIVSHTYIAPINRIKWVVLANKYQDAELKVVIPKYWSASFFNINSGDLSEFNIKNCEFISLETRKAGNEVLYSYKFFDLIKILKKFKPDIVHVEQGDNAFCYFQLILLSKILRLKTKFVFFTWVNWQHKWSLKYRFIWSFIEKFNLKNSCGAIVGNCEAEKVLRNKNFLKPVEILPQLGVNEKYFKPVCLAEHKSDGFDFVRSSHKATMDYAHHERSPRSVHPAVPDGVLCEVWDPGSNKFKIGFIGRIVKEKGVFDLVKAFSLIDQKDNKWQLVFVGDGKEKENLIKFVKINNLQNSIEFLPAVSHENIGKILNQFDIFVLPSYDIPEWKEQFGHVLIEAMACKIPVIGSTGGNIPNVINDAGLIFKQGDINDLATKLKNLMFDVKLRNYFADKGYERYKNNFSYEFITDKTYFFWKKIL